MNILIIGTGYVGATTAMVFAESGWQVTGLDVDADKIERLRQGRLHFHEPGLEDLIAKHVHSGRLLFTTDKETAIAGHDVIFICVGTPSRPDGSADLRYIQQVAEDIGYLMNGYKLVVTKSTVPVGTQEQVKAWIEAAQRQPHPFDVASNPEFLREGKAVEDALQPDRIVIGTDSAKASEQLLTLYQSFQCPRIITTPRTAELIKYASNAFLATKISYMNELAKLCDEFKVNVNEVADGMGLDPRIGPSFLQAGLGYGGSCFPKDVSELVMTARAQAVQLHILEQVMEVNRIQPTYLLDKARSRLGDFANKNIAMLGLAFKPNTDDIREAPALRMIHQLLLEQANVRLFDPVATLPAHSSSYEAVTVCASVEEAIQNADAVILCTEWAAFGQLDWENLKGLLNQLNFFDGRNMMDARWMRGIGFYYQGIGND
ncbi:UDPglucose 6-dehydrogenase [Paenibacillus cellulosilyticus]|uniref:UDP-glucose 6-dehydrogenase n=1 Tax=Paenibacillus cellulosilyticus TaxID=375489 RepID=A0A2V2YZI5_9BACL|nr:UDP-glucose/GDP-mannose dehydrogenase family protein [Paenibacillus cellulosilyticus]PWV99324.1 UDPglucose 6-dehydrogenase [Paenibacillus cellulosilyticus]QKS45089.1 UDP-glucose/GDP-mannose dehydrogenase family protein [Paenibacillus cellulosilyticus]